MISLLVSLLVSFSSLRHLSLESQIRNHATRSTHTDIQRNVQLPSTTFVSFNFPVVNADLVLRGDISTTITISNDSAESNSQNWKPQYNPLGIDSYQSCFICTNTSLALNTISFALADNSEQEAHKTSHCSLIHSSHVTATNCNFIISVGASPFIVFETTTTLEDQSSSLTLVSSSISNSEGVIGSFSDFAPSNFEGTHFTQVISSSEFRSSSLLHGDGIALRQPHLTFPASSLSVSSTISSTSFRNMSSPATQNRRPNFHFSQNAVGCDLHSTANHLSGCPFRGLDKGGSFSCRNTTFTALMEQEPTPISNAAYEKAGETFETSKDAPHVAISSSDYESITVMNCVFKGYSGYSTRALAILIQQYDNSVIISDCQFINLESNAGESTEFLSGAVLIRPEHEEHAYSFKVQISTCTFESCYCIGGPGAMFLGSPRNRMTFIVGCTINNCSSFKHGGAVKIDMKGSLNLINTSFSRSDTWTNHHGGSALQVSKCDYLLVRDCLFDSNRQDVDSTVYVENVTQARFSSCIFSDNVGTTDYSSGGRSHGAFVAKAAIRLEMTGCSFTNNQGQFSAALYLDRYVESVVMDDTSFWNNFAHGGPYVLNLEAEEMTKLINASSVRNCWAKNHYRVTDYEELDKLFPEQFEEIQVNELFVSSSGTETEICSKEAQCYQLTDALTCRNDQKTKISLSGAIYTENPIILDGSIELAGLGTEFDPPATSFQNQAFQLAESSSVKIYATNVFVGSAPFVTQDTASDLVLSEILVNPSLNDGIMSYLLHQSAGTSLVTMSSFTGYISPSLIRIIGVAKATISDVLFTNVVASTQYDDPNVNGICITCDTSGDVSILRCGFESTKVQEDYRPVYLDGKENGNVEVQWCRFADTSDTHYIPYNDLVAVNFEPGKLKIDYSTIEMLPKDKQFDIDGVTMKGLPPPFLIYEYNPEDQSTLNWRDRKPQKAETLNDTGLQPLLNSLNNNIHTTLLIECEISAAIKDLVLENCSIQTIFWQDQNIRSTITCDTDVTLVRLDESSFELRQVDVQVSFYGTPISPLFSIDPVSSLRLDTVQFQREDFYPMPSIVKSTGGSVTLHKLILDYVHEFWNPMADMEGGVLTVSQTLLEAITITSGALLQTTGTSVNIMDSSFLEMISSTAQANVLCAELSGDQTIRVYGFHQNASEQVTFRNMRTEKKNLMISVNGSTTIEDPIYFSSPPNISSPRPARFSGNGIGPFVSVAETVFENKPVESIKPFNGYSYLFDNTRVVIEGDYSEEDKETIGLFIGIPTVPLAGYSSEDSACVYGGDMSCPSITYTLEKSETVPLMNSSHPLRVFTVSYAVSEDQIKLSQQQIVIQSSSPYSKPKISPDSARFSLGSRSSLFLLETNTDLKCEGLTFCIPIQIETYFQIDTTSKMIISNCAVEIGVGLFDQLFLCKGGTLTISDTEFSTNSGIFTIRGNLIKYTQSASKNSGPETDSMALSLSNVKINGSALTSIRPFFDVTTDSSFIFQNVIVDFFSSPWPQSYPLLQLTSNTLAQIVTPEYFSGSYESFSYQDEYALKGKDTSDVPITESGDITLLFFLLNRLDTTIHAKGLGKDAKGCGNATLACQSFDEAVKHFGGAGEHILFLDGTVQLTTTLQLQQTPHQISIKPESSSASVVAGVLGGLKNLHSTGTHTVLFSSIEFNLTGCAVESFIQSNCGTLEVKKCSFLLTSQPSITLLSVSGGSVIVDALDIPSLKPSTPLFSLSSFVQATLNDVNITDFSSQSLITATGSGEASKLFFTDCRFDGIAEQARNEEEDVVCVWTNGVIEVSDCVTELNRCTFNEFEDGVFKIEKGTLIIHPTTTFEHNGRINPSFPSAQQTISCNNANLIFRESNVNTEGRSRWVSVGDDGCSVKEGQTTLLSTLFVPSLDTSECSGGVKEKMVEISLVGSMLVPCDLKFEVFYTSSASKNDESLLIPISTIQPIEHNHTHLSFSLPITTLTESLGKKSDLSARLVVGDYLHTTSSFTFLDKKSLNGGGNSLSGPWGWLIPMIVVITLVVVSLIIILIILDRRRRRKESPNEQTEMPEMGEIEKIEMDPREADTMGASLLMTTHERDETNHDIGMTKGQPDKDGEEEDNGELIPAISCHPPFAEIYVQERSTLFNRLHGEHKKPINARAVQRELTKGLAHVMEKNLNNLFLTMFSSHAVMFGKDDKVCLKLTIEPTPSASIPTQQELQSPQDQDQLNEQHSPQQQNIPAAPPSRQIQHEGLRWFAPEVNGGKNLAADGHKAAVFSLGLVLWEIETGQVPYGELDAINAQRTAGLGVPPVMPSSMNRTIRELIEKCLSVDPSERPPISTIQETLDELDSPTHHQDQKS
ncbi:hypothetical protein BLNAU_15316 [Blattamonas nauphoetae]|uniref:Serine-threonine/tyrosine-protein kinase catalytic domain-containing protein n=1 Tax=Blattamonas nauphoetae TaxID=2049346 RepID=A0ABQ9XEI6_9EUKA|nr:hypothetical protein BLNAU_15316 [Blattamonas nauphoetae]